MTACGIMWSAMWDLSWWQTALTGVGATGTFVAAVAAAFALRYFKRQAASMAATLEATLHQMAVEQDRWRAQQERWEDERRRDIRRDHRAVRPDVRVAISGGDLAPDSCGMTVHVSDVKQVLDLRATAVLESGTAVRCQPDYWATLTRDAEVFNIRPASVSTGDRGRITLTFVDTLGGTVFFSQEFVADVTGGNMRLTPDGVPTVTDDLFPEQAGEG